MSTRGGGKKRAAAVSFLGPAQVNAGGAKRFRYTVTLPELQATGSLLADNSTHAQCIVRRAYPRNALVTVTRVHLLPFAFCLLPFCL